MKRLILPLLIVGALLGSATAQEPEPKPEFNNAPVTDVLVWAQRSIGCGFIFEAETLRGADGRPRGITATHVQPATQAERTLLLFELLRRCGLVAFEVGGLPGPTYQLYDAQAAARAAPLYRHPDEAAGTTFGGLSIQLKRASAVEVATRIRRRLSDGAGAVEVIEATQTLIVTDYTDRLHAAWEIATAAENAADRDDDLVVRDFALRAIPAEKATAALERLREPEESWKVAPHETANVLLFSGRRDELERVLERTSKLDSHEERPEFAEETRRIKVIFADPGHVARTLREMFSERVRAGGVQIGVFERDRAIIFRGSNHDYRRALDTVRLLDVDPRGNAEGRD